MLNEQGNQTTPPVVTPASDAGQGNQVTPSQDDKGQNVVEIDGEKFTTEQIKDMKTRAASYDELRPKYTKVTQRLAELESDEDDEDGQGAGERGGQPTTTTPGYQPTTDPKLAAEVTYLKRSVGKLMESVEEQALEKKMTELKGKFPDMDELEVLAALSVDPNIDPEEAAAFSDKRNKEKTAKIREAVSKEKADKLEGKLETGGGSTAHIPTGEAPKTIQEAGKRFLERLRAANQAAQ
jgi:hypothetical protein